MLFLKPTELTDLPTHFETLVLHVYAARQQIIDCASVLPNRKKEYAPNLLLIQTDGVVQGAPDFCHRNHSTKSAWLSPPDPDPVGILKRLRTITKHRSVRHYWNVRFHTAMFKATINFPKKITLQQFFFKRCAVTRHKYNKGCKWMMPTVMS